MRGVEKIDTCVHLCCALSVTKKKDARTKRFGLNAEEERRLERAKNFNLETSEVVRL